MTTATGPLGVSVGDLFFRNPIILPSGTAGYGHELEGVVDLDRVGGFVTKAVSVAPRPGAPAPRVAEFPGGMINAVGLANPGVAAVCADHLPWLAAHHRGTRRFANVIGFAVEEFPEIIERLDHAIETSAPHALDGYELNVSCPNTKAGGVEFGADPRALADVVTRARAATRRPIFVKLAPTLSDIGGAAKIAADAGADGITVVNTIPGMVIDLESRRPALGFGTGGVSGPAILPVGVLATWKVRKAVALPIIGVGGVASAEDALQYIVAGASLVGVGTAALRDPRAPERIVSGIEQWCRRHEVSTLAEVRGSLKWPA
ncbi:MAG TPA: dihydroorotate dehydrogenase [Gemmatimonadaceae bacterium]|nr:dihydroorotate dehydrogenase [Gemmatimonadaceae bacterium]